MFMHILQKSLSLFTDLILTDDLIIFVISVKRSFWSIIFLCSYFGAVWKCLQCAYFPCTCSTVLISALCLTFIYFGCKYITEINNKSFKNSLMWTITLCTQKPYILCLYFLKHFCFEKGNSCTLCHKCEQAKCIKLIASRYIMTKVLYEHEKHHHTDTENKINGNSSTHFCDPIESRKPKCPAIVIVVKAKRRKKILLCLIF